jgi:hypothetical protein
MSRSRRIRPALLALLLAALLSITGGCGAAPEQNLVGTWTTQLTGYSTTAQSVTKYDQTVTFKSDGSVDFQTTLPGEAVNGQAGTYSVSRSQGALLLAITWMGVPTPTELYIQVNGNKLLTSKSSTGLKSPPQLNVTNADPVLYIRK